MQINSFAKGGMQNLAPLRGNLAFGGVKPPYKKGGYQIIPIAHDPKPSEIKEAIDATKTGQTPMEGLNGRAYFLGEDLVVKHYKGEEAFKNNPRREIDMLDFMFDHGFCFPNSQKGQFAFETPDGEFYTVSDRVKGEEPQCGVYFTKENLESLGELITQMDKGAVVENSSKTGGSNICRFMDYDFNGGNMKLTDTTAGLFDFEYSVAENIDDMIKRGMIDKTEGYNCNASDTSPLASNMRSFEYWTLCDYLKQEDNADETFEDFLEVKGKYHNEMSEYFKEFAPKSAHTSLAEEISRREAAHGRLLVKDENGKIPSDIKRAEAIKIQAANFVHEQGMFCSTGHVNPPQLREYLKYSEEYFKDNFKAAYKTGDSDRMTYYGDALQSVASWSKVNNDIDWRIKTKDADTLSKIVDEPILTLEEVLTF